MTRFSVLMFALLLGVAPLARAEDKAAMEAIDKAIQALGGEEKLSKISTAETKSKATLTFGDNSGDMTMNATMKGMDQYRVMFEGEFGGQDIKGMTILNGDKGWRKIGPNTMEMDDDAIANEKRTLYLQMSAGNPTLLKTKGFKVEAAGSEDVAGKPATILKVTGPDGKDFKLYLDKESGLPVRQTATVAGFQGDTFVQDSKYSEYKDFGGIKKASKVISTRDGEPFLELEVINFKTLDKVDPALFQQP